MISRKIVFTLLLVICSVVAFSQDKQEKSRVAHKKGDFFAYWGWNRAAYTNSTIHFTGNDYNFKFHTVKAKDRPSTFSYHNYFQPNRISIPQTNFRIGYFIKDNFAITVGVDHMKYVMTQDQTVNFTGSIEHAGYQPHVNTDGSVKLTEDFLTFEHTDGLNYLNVEAEYYQKIYESRFFKLNALVGAGAGAMMPKSNVKLMDKERHDANHLAGFGLTAKLGIETVFWDIAFLRLEGKEGYINMPGIRTSASSSDKASQQFFFAEVTYVFGAKWRF